MAPVWLTPAIGTGYIGDRTMDDDHERLDELLAASMDAPEELLPHLPALLRDLEDIGARSGDVVRVLHGRGLSADSHVLDLGCGKGAAAIAIAKAFGARVRGIDGVAPFIEHARRRADAEGVGELCTFEVEDVREVVRSAADYDVVMLLALGPLFGDAGQTVEALRRCARTPGGLLVIDDAYIAEGAAAPEGAHGCHDHASTVALLQSRGDRVVGEQLMDAPESDDYYRSMTAKILHRARELAQTAEPELAELLIEFAERQQRETETLCDALVGALWLIELRD